MDNVGRGFNIREAAEIAGLSYDAARGIYSRKTRGTPAPDTGRISYLKPNNKPLPAKGEVARYIVTSAQNNTHVNGRFWNNLLAYAKSVRAQIMVSRFRYDLRNKGGAYETKPGQDNSGDDQEWYDAALGPYICDNPRAHGSRRWRLAPGLLFCAEMQILPTAVRPLSGLETYTGRESAIFPHAKLAMESVASMPDEATKFVYTTGAVTQRNYTQTKAGLKAEFHHAYAALIVEVNHKGEWWVRQINADSDGTFYDIPNLGIHGCTRVKDGKVEHGKRTEAINWGDVHFSEMEPDVYATNWHRGGILDTLGPRYQFLHDTLSFRSRTHHEENSFGKMLAKHYNEEESVEAELFKTADAVRGTFHADVETVIINSNHDNHGEQWLDRADYRRDPINAEIFLEAQLDRVRAIKSGKEWDFLTWALGKYGVHPTIVPKDGSFIICPEASGGIECGLHGDLGPNGARGSTQNLTKLARRINKGHDHSATIRDGVYSAGACRVRFPYMKGPGSHSISHILTYPNGKRTLITVWKGKFRA